MFQAVLFDLDGTLTDTLTDISEAMNRALRLHGLPEWPRDAYRYLVGNGAKILSERCVREQQAMAPAVRATYQAWYETHSLVATQPYAGVPEMLAALAARGVKLTVLSNKPDADTKNVVRHFFPDVPWTLVRGQVEGVPVKPDPAGALALSEKIGVPPDEILYLGDTAVDMQCATAAGMYAVGALWGFRTEEELLQSGAKVIARMPMDVVKMFDV